MKSISFVPFTCITFCLLLCTTPTHTTRFIQGNSTFPNTFTSEVLAKAFDIATGTLYLGKATTPSADKSNISKVGRSVNTTLLRTTGISDNLTGFLALATFPGNTTPLITGTAPVGVTGNTSVFALNNIGSINVSSAVLRSASSVINSPGAATQAIVALAANNNFIFAAVRPNSAAFGNTNSGIAVVHINRNLTATNAPLSSLVQTAAQVGDSGIKAKTLDPTTPEVFSQPGGTTPQEGLIFSPPALYWDEQLQRLYAGLIVTSGSMTDDIARSVVVARILDTGVMEYSAVAPDSAITPNTPAAQDEIVAGNTTGDTFDLTVSHLGVMHASTGPSYLIVNGGNGDAGETNAKIFALPLVDRREPDGDIDPADDAEHGTLADKNSPLVNFKFVTPATAPGELVQDPTIAGTDFFALVGGTPLPLFQADITTMQPISDMIVVGDTVYVAVRIPQSDTTETGIIYSQAKFGPDGKIVGWTPWAKRGFPYNGIFSPLNPGASKFVEIDAVTGDVWSVGGDSNQSVAVTEWDHGTTPESLATVLNRILTKGSYSVLDLDAFTRGFDGNTAQRYALFGGVNTVVFARISESRDGTNSLAPQMVVDDFTETENLRTTVLPPHSGIVTTLEYARRLNTLTNYFFAGTQTGLYVFSATGGGFNANQLSTLDTFPFGGTWTKAPNISGSVIDVKTLGNRLYVLTYTTSAQQPMQSTLYAIDFASSIAAMFAPANIHIIAQTNAATAFGAISIFNGIQLIGTNDTSTTEQLVLATNKGLFKSSTVGGVQTANTQAAAAWSVITDSTSTYYFDIAGMDPSVVTNFFDTGFPTTVWPISVRDAHGYGTNDRGSVQQLNGTSDTGPFEFVPTGFSFNGQGFGPNFITLPPISYFFSDGARRFFIATNLQTSPALNFLMVSPFEAFAWNVTNPVQNVLFDPALGQCQLFNWVKQIGMSGILMVGTNNGVVALE